MAVVSQLVRRSGGLKDAFSPHKRSLSLQTLRVTSAGSRAGLYSLKYPVRTPSPITPGSYLRPFIVHFQGRYNSINLKASADKPSEISGRDEEQAPIGTKKKASLIVRIRDELKHYWTGTKLLGAEIKISVRLLAKIMGGQKLLRRERRQLKRTMADLARLVPFFVILIIPFMELALPIIIKLLPGFLPSTFRTEDSMKIKKLNLQKTRLEAAKLLRAPKLDEADRTKLMASSKTFNKFFTNLATKADLLSVEEMIEISKLFPNSVTIQGLPRSQLVNICRYLDIVSIGPDTFLRAIILRRLNYIDADDHTIISESISSYSDSELKQICSSRGIRVYSKNVDQLLAQLSVWLDLSTRKKVPNALLILSNAAELVDSGTTDQEDPIYTKLKLIIRTIYSFPEEVLLEAKMAIKEAAGTATLEERLTYIQEQEEFIEKELSDEEKEQKEKRIVGGENVNRENGDIATGKMGVMKCDYKSYNIYSTDANKPGTATSINNEESTRINLRS